MDCKLALGALALVLGAPALGQITVYGLLDTGIERVNHIDANGNSATRMPSLTGSFPSRLGFRGTEDLGDGLSAVFQLESAFGVDTGLQGQGGRLFGRQAWLGLKGGFGTLTLGRQYNMTFYSLLKADVMGPSIHGVTNMDSYLPNARSDNSLAYQGNLGHLVAGASYSLGRDASPAGFGGPSATNCPGEAAQDRRACRQATAMLGYDNSAWGVYGSWDLQRGGPGASNGLTRSSEQDRRRAVSGYLIAGPVKFGAGWLQRKASGAVPLESNLHFIGASVADGLWTYDGQYARQNVAASPNDSTLYIARIVRHLSKRTAVYGSWAYVRNRGTAAIAVDAGGTVGKGLGQSGQMVGLRHLF